MFTLIFSPGVGSAASRVLTQSDATGPSEDPLPANHGPALIPEDELIGDDWLIDDMSINSKRKHAGDPAGLTSTFGTKPNKRKRDGEGNGEKDEQRRKRGSSQGGSTVAAEMHSATTVNTNSSRTDAIEVDWNDSDGDVNLIDELANYDFEEKDDIITSSPSRAGLPDLQTKPKKARQVRMTAFGIRTAQQKSTTSQRAVSSTPTNSATLLSSSRTSSQASTVSNTQLSLSGSAASQVAPPTPLLMKLKVRIKDKLLLVPIRNR